MLSRYLWFLFLLLPSLASAQSSPSTRPAPKKNKKKKPPIFESVTVGQRTPEDPFRTPRSTTVVNKKRLNEKRPRSVPEALMEESGVFVQKTNHAGGAPFLRGTVGPQILIIIDGIRLNNATFRSGPNQYLSMIDPNYLQSLEVLRGPGSIAYGSYAFGGVISATSLDTPMTQGREFVYQGALVGRYGSADNELTTHAYFGGSIRGFAFQGGVSYGYFGNLSAGGNLFSNEATQAGTYLFPKTNWGNFTLLGNSGRQPFTGYQHLFLHGKVRWRINATWQASIAYQRAQHFNAGRADQFESRGRVRYYDNERDLVYTRLHGNFNPIRTQMEWTLSYHRQGEQREQQTLDKSTYTLTKENRNQDETQTIGLNWQGTTRIGQWLRLSYGFDGYADLVESSAQSRSTGTVFKDTTSNFTPGSNYITAGLYAMARIRLLRWNKRGGLFLHIGERLNGFFAYAPKREVLEEVSFQQIGHAPYASLQMLISQHLNASFSYAEGFRAPNLQEASSLGDQGNFFEVANPNLSPELSRTLELHVKARLPKRFEAWLTGYVSFWNDLIERAPTTYQGQSEFEGKTVVQPFNQANARVIGVESGIRWRLWKGLEMTGNVTWTQGRAIDEKGKETPLSRIAPIFGKLSFAYRFANQGFIELYAIAAEAQTELSARDKRDARIPEDGTPGWWTLNLRGGAPFNTWSRVVFSIENLLDQRYKYHGSGVMGAGLSGRISLELKL